MFKKMTKLATGCLLVSSLIFASGAWADENSAYYTVQKGDSLWKISRQYGTTVETLKANNKLQTDMLQIGQRLLVKGTSTSTRSLMPETLVSRGGVVSERSTSTSKTHAVQKGESPWSISNHYGIPLQELLQANGLTQQSTLTIGQVLTIPVHNVPVKATAGAEYGELLDWWTEAQYVWPIDTVATVIDFHTKKSWQVKRSYGAAHADVEPLTAADAATMKAVWGGKWSWTIRPVIVEVNGHRIAASASAMPHSIEKITDNNFAGHSDIHFLNSRRHKDNLVNEEHQRQLLIAGGK